MKNIFISLLLLIIVHQDTFSQISGYGSVSYGQSTNPLYNYQKVSDQLLQTYVEINSDYELESSPLRFQYVGGSVLFHRFTLRNNYEHRIVAGFDTKIFSGSESDIVDDSVSTDQQDSTGVFFHSDIQFAARHDKNEFREFDNTGYLWNNSLQYNLEYGLVGRMINKIEYRYYQYLHPYQNLTEILSINLDNGTETQFQCGIFISGGFKYFPKIKYDTSLFEETRSYIIQTVLDSTLVGNGINRHWVYNTYPDTNASDKMVIKKPNTKTAYQMAFGGFIQQSWNGISLRAEVVYRINSQSTLLTLVQNTSTLTLNEDLYNSVFSAHGPELHCVVKYILPMDIQLASNIDFAQSTFETPTYDLVSGDLVKSNRIDIRSNIELYISKIIQITDGFGFDVSISSSYLQNKSNDAYNDYSVFGNALSLGCSF